VWGQSPRTISPADALSSTTTLTTTSSCHLRQVIKDCGSAVVRGRNGAVTDPLLHRALGTFERNSQATDDHKKGPQVGVPITSSVNAALMYYLMVVTGRIKPCSAVVVDGGEVVTKQADAGNALHARGLGNERVGMNAAGSLGLI